MTPTVLVVGQAADRHVEAVSRALQARGVTPLVLDIVGCDAPESRVSLAFGHGGPTGAVQVEGRWHALDEVDAVWWRVKLLSSVAPVVTGPVIAGDFALREWRSALDSLEAFTRRARWVNSRTADQTARHKPIQLAVAQSLGLEVPETLISNSVETIGAFMASDDDHVYKALTWCHEPPDRMIFTSTVSRDDVLADPEAVELAPGIFQARVPKKYELRVTVVGDRALAVRIDSQSREDTSLDWRRNQYEVPYAAHELDTDVEEALVSMNAELGLAFGAHDLVVTPDDRLVFLEVNPMGQWLWLERATGVPITEALADHLVCRDMDSAGPGAWEWKETR